MLFPRNCHQYRAQPLHVDYFPEAAWDARSHKVFLEGLEFPSVESSLAVCHHGSQGSECKFDVRIFREFLLELG